MISGRTYLDYNASAPLRPEARAAMIAAFDLVGNPSSVHAEGRRARAVIETARTSVAELADARPADVVFTSGASEANATVLAGGWDMIFLSDIEHDSVRASAQKSGARIIKIAPPCTSDGVEAFRRTLEQMACEHRSGEHRTGAGLGRALLCVQMANNETGAIQPVAEMAAVARAHGVRVHCDAVQAPGRMPIAAAALGVDYLTVSAHKLGGPKGVGALVIVDGAPLAALIAGGGQERGRRSGTENIAAIAGFGAAARCAVRDVLAVDRIGDLRDELEDCIRLLSPRAVVVGRQWPRLANTSCIALRGVLAETMVIRMDLAGVAISAGAACSSGKMGQSPTLAALGGDAEVSRSAVRISLGYATTRDDVQALLAAWKDVVATYQRAA